MSATPEVRCPFCARINRFEYEIASLSTVRFEPLNPVTPGHMLFVPNGHIEHGPLARDFVAAAMGAAEKYGVERGEDFNLITSSGPDATQTVAHVHVHYVPRRPGDGLPLPWTPQQAAVTPVAPQGAATPADERLCEAADRRGFVMLRDDATDDELAHADREFVDAVRAALATSPADEALIERLRAEVADLRENPRDEYHTMRELYDYRMLYNAHAAHGWLAAGIPVVKSWRHSDGEECFGGGWFIVTATLPTGQVSNHYEAERWDLFRVPEVDLPPAYDGHTPADAADRLLSALYAYQGGPYLAASPAEPGFEVWQRLARAAFLVDSTHHFHEGPDGRPVCACGFVGSARKRSQTEHITAAVLEAFDHD